MSMRLYLAGPMTGMADLNFPAFNEAEATLTAAGYGVENPATNPKCPDWASYMRLSLAQIARSDGIALLPNWWLSKGATLEVHVAAALSMPIRAVGEWLADAVAS